MYPDRTRAADYLRLYARAFDTVEIDSTFYAIPAEKTVRGWADRAPNGFAFSPKLPQSITHDRHLRDASDELARFTETIRALGDKLGIILVQLAPDFGPAEFSAFAEFLPTLPRDLRFAVEFRQKGWMTQDVYDVCRDHGVAIALSDGRWIPRKWTLQLAERPTAEFAYVRWMGPNRDITQFGHTQVDRTREIEEWLHALRTLGGLVPQVYGYVNNHFAGHAPATVRALQGGLGLRVVSPDSLREQTSLF
jgi:uncharacterized protein YecE (DUF72 family)